MSDSFEDAPDVVVAGTANHLADLESRYDTHVLALRKHAAALQAATARAADALAAPPPAPAGHDPTDP